MDNVVSIRGGRPVSDINGVVFPTPMSRIEYLAVCKKFLTMEDYRDILCCIMDDSFFHDMDPALKRIIDSYFSFPD